MSKLDNIVLNCVNKALDGKEEKLGDYIDPTKEEIKELILELANDVAKNWTNAGGTIMADLRREVEEL